METHTRGSGREAALRDWHQCQVRHMAIGTPPIGTPMYNRTQGLFYTGGFACASSHEEEMYCHEYNRTIAWLIDKYGVPDWAPVRRLPTAASLLKLLTEQGESFEFYSAKDASERKAVDFVLYYWKTRHPSLWIRLEHSSLLIWGGDISINCGRIDVIDYLGEVRWMAVYKFAPDEYPALPWRV